MEQSEQPWSSQAGAVHHGQVQPPLEYTYTVDGEELPRSKAHLLARRMFQFGFAFLPLLWLMNLWLFWPDFRAKQDPVLARYTRLSALGLTASTVLLLPWFIYYLAAGSSLPGDIYGKLDVTTLPIRQYLGL